MNNTNNSIKTITTAVANYTLILTTFLLPLFLLPTTSNVFDPSKLILLTLATCLIVFAWMIKAMVQAKLTLTISPFTAPLFLLGSVYVLSSIISQPNPMQAFMGKGLLIPLLTVLFIAITSGYGLKSRLPFTRTRSFIPALIWTMLISSTVLSFIIIVQHFAAISLAPDLNRLLGVHLNPDLPFNPTGSPVVALSFLASQLVFALVFMLTRTIASRNREAVKRALLAAVITLTAVASLVSLNQLLARTDGGPGFILPSASASYVIALETFKQPAKTVVLGWGPEGYLNAFTRTRPVYQNLTDTWDTRFVTGSNELFTTVTTVGLVGILVWFFLISRVLKQLRNKTASPRPLHPILTPIKAATAALFIVQLLLPANIMIIFTTFLFLTLWSLALKTSNHPDMKVINLGETPLKNIRIQTASHRSLNATPYLIGLPVIIGIVFMLYHTTQVYRAETAFKQSFDKALENDGLGALTLQQTAIRLNPRVANYHRTLANTNLLIANALATNLGDRDMTDQERQAISDLIISGITSAKNAVALDPQNVQNWEALANTYRQVIGVAPDAESWTIAAYNQAMSVDPLSPRLRLELGNIYFQLENIDAAIRLYQQAVERKPNWASGHYNLALAHQEKGELQTALLELETTASLLEPDSADFSAVQELITTLREELQLEDTTATPPEPSGELTGPEPLPEPILDEPIELPDEAGLESDEATPSAENQ